MGKLSSSLSPASDKMCSNAALYGMVASMGWEDVGNMHVEMPLVVQELPRVFLEKLTEFPPHREIKFVIDLLPDTFHCIVSDGTGKIGGNGDSVERSFRGCIYPPKYFTLGRSGLICEKEK